MGLFEHPDPYFNDKCKKLSQERDALIQKYNAEINREYENEKAKYKFDWKNFSMLICFTAGPFLMVWLNHKIFHCSSMFAWCHYKLNLYELWFGK